jgi:hypothetical protein
VPGIGPGTETAELRGGVGADGCMCMITPDEFGTSSAFALESTKDLLFGILVKLSVIVVPSLSLNPERSTPLFRRGQVFTDGKSEQFYIATKSKSVLDLVLMKGHGART